MSNLKLEKDQPREKQPNREGGADKTQQSRWTFAAMALLVLTKAKSLLTVLKLSKIGAPLVSMFISMGAYAVFFPFQFALGLVVMLLFHELGHVIAARMKGMPVSKMMFIPFLGAYVALKRSPKDAVTEAFFAFGGPVLGTIAAMAAFVLGLALNSNLLLVIANVGFLLNLLNLLPIQMLDGGKIAKAVTRWLWLVGLVGGLVVVIMLKAVIFFVIWALFAWDLYQKYVKNAGGRKVLSATTKLTVPLEELRRSGAIIPGEEHKRELPFETFSNLEMEQFVRVKWEALGLDETIRMPGGMQSVIRKVHVTGTSADSAEFPGRLVVYCQVDYTPHEADNYYEVPTATRWRYGAAYAALAAVLVLMLVAVHHQGIPSVL